MKRTTDAETLARLLEHTPTRNGRTQAERVQRAHEILAEQPYIQVECDELIERFRKLEKREKRR